MSTDYVKKSKDTFASTDMVNKRNTIFKSTKTLNIASPNVWRF